MKNKEVMLGLSLAGVMLLACLIVYATVASAQNAPTYVGLQGCKCHKTEIEDWSKSPHGKALDSLSPDKRSKSQRKAMHAAGLDFKKDYSKDEKCLPCHVVGYGEPGGYSASNSADAFVNVGCEMCHGAGSGYAKIHKEKEETYTRAEVKAVGQRFPRDDESVCRRCHDHKDSPFNSKLDKNYMFDYKEMIKLEKAWHKVNKLMFKHE